MTRGLPRMSMSFCNRSGTWGCLSTAEQWRSRGRTAVAMVAFARARLLVEVLPFRRWRHGLGWASEGRATDLRVARRLAAHVDWAARLLPFETKCLPRT